jgi:hypothetical protein
MGCGKTKPLADFQKIRKTHEHYDGVCKDCRNKARRKPKELMTDSEAFNQLNRLMANGSH